jgi:glycosyltransferase involved in cell wall biosynthesis
MPAMHGAVVDEELPYPPTSGKRIRTLNLLSRMASRHRITYFCHQNADPREVWEAKAFLNGIGLEAVVASRSVPPKSGPAFYGRLAASLLSPLPYSVASHCSRALSRAIRAYAAEHRIDLWHCEWTPYAQVLDGAAEGPLLVMAHNIESLIWQRYHENERNLLKRWYIGKQWRKFERFERRTFARATRVVAVSAEDATTARERFHARHVCVVDNGVDLEYFRPLGGPCDPHQLLFLGSLDWRPNQDGLVLLLEHVYPRVRAAEPAARLCIVGRNPPAWLEQLVQACPGAELHGNVADVRPFLAASALLVVPLRIGGGSRLKILEALASGLPVVSTRIGAEGLCLEPERDLRVVEDMEQMPGVLLESLRNPAPLQQMAEHGRRVVCERYGWDGLADKLEQVWYECTQGAFPDRQAQARSQTLQVQ